MITSSGSLLGIRSLWTLWDNRVLAIVQVRSCTLDTWLPEQVAFMAETGNHKANAFLEANLREEQKPGYDTAELASFIRKKVELFATLNFFQQGISLSLLICCLINEQIMRLMINTSAFLYRLHTPIARL